MPEMVAWLVRRVALPHTFYHRSHVLLLWHPPYQVAPLQCVHALAQCVTDSSGYSSLSTGFAHVAQPRCWPEPSAEEARSHWCWYHTQSQDAACRSFHCTYFVAHVEEAGVLLFCVWLAGRFLLLAVLSVLAGSLIGGGSGSPRGVCDTARVMLQSCPMRSIKRLSSWVSCARIRDTC